MKISIIINQGYPYQIPIPLFLRPVSAPYRSFSQLSGAFAIIVFYILTVKCIIFVTSDPKCSFLVAKSRKKAQFRIVCTFPLLDLSPAML